MLATKRREPQVLELSRRRGQATLPHMHLQTGNPVALSMILSVVVSPVACGAASAPEHADAARTRLNIMMIVSDDQGFRDLGCYGHPDIRTPHLDRLAREGVRLTSFYVSCPACTPSRGSLLTGRYPQRNGTTDLFRNDAVDLGFQYDAIKYASSPERVLGMDVREVLISQVLEKAGYANGIFGKWDLGQLRRFLPLQRGFHDFYGFVNTGIDYWTHERYGIPSMYRNNAPTIEDKGTYATYLLGREAERFLHQNKDRPFFLYVPFNAPHGASNLDPSVGRSVQAPAEYIARYPEPKNDRESRKRLQTGAVRNGYRYREVVQR